MTTSLKVAEVFGKNHFDVLRSIEALDCSGEFRKRNFAFSSYQPAGARRSYPMVLMTRDGFTILAMGFTGAKAAEFKEKYIAEFNRMEEYIKSQSKFALPATFADALRALADETEKSEKLAADNALMLPNVNTLNLGEKCERVYRYIIGGGCPPCPI